MKRRCKHCSVPLHEDYRVAKFAGFEFCRASCVDGFARGETIRLRGWLSLIVWVCRGVAKSYAGIALNTDRNASRTGG